VTDNISPPKLDALSRWLASPPGRYVLAWEAAQYDELTADMFGYHAVQLGWPEADALRSNRMPQRWIVGSGTDLIKSQNKSKVLSVSIDSNDINNIALAADFSELPFDSASLDLVVLPHTLEFSRDPHGCLREVERVLVPEGKLVISGFNSWSLWGARQFVGTKLLRSRTPFMPETGQFIRYSRCKDWLRLLGFELERGRFGCYRPPCRSQAWLDRFAFLEHTGDRWWWVLGATYSIVAVKRVKNMHINAAAWKKQAVTSGKFAPVANNLSQRDSSQHD
jgi:SAM-dependent methyltransferase